MQDVSYAEQLVHAASGEIYARSLRAIVAAGGRLAAGEVVEDASAWAARRQLHEEYGAALGEMINSDSELSPNLEISRLDMYQVAEGKVISYDGVTPVSELVDNGVTASQLAALQDRRMETQARRDQADRRNARAVDAMAAGDTAYNTRVVVSMDPKEAMARDGADFWRAKGYREGMAFIQLYHRAEDGDMLAGTYSVDLSDKDHWRATLAQYGVEVPADAHTDNWLDFAIEATLSTEAAKRFGGQVRERYYHTAAIAQGRVLPRRHSVDSFMQAHETVVTGMFNALYMPMAVSAASGIKHEAVHTFAAGLLQNAQSLSPEVRSGLMRVCARSRFSHDDARLMDTMIRYGVVEKLRQGVTQLITEKRSFSAETPLVAWQPNFMDDLVRSVISGADAGRSYDHCGIKVEISSDTQTSGPGANPQEAFGGKGKDAWHAGKIHRNTECRCCRKVKEEVGACFICQECVSDPKKMQRAYDLEQLAAKRKASSVRIVPLSGLPKKPRYVLAA